MQYDPNYKRDAVIKDENCDIKFYDNHTRFEGTLKPTWFKAKIIYCRSSIYQGKNKWKPDQIDRTEMLEVVLLNEKSDKYFTWTIYGARQSFVNNMWGNWSKNPAELHDLLSLVARQKPNVNITENYSFEVNGKEYTCYPRLCGTELFVLGAQTSERMAKDGAFYPRYKFYAFDPNGFSAVELDEGISEKEKIDAKNADKQIKEDYLSFMTKKFGSLDRIPDEYQLTQAPKKEVVEQVKAEPMVDPAPAPTPAVQNNGTDDDVPF